LDIQDLVPRIPDIEYMDNLFALGDLAEIMPLFFDLHSRALMFLGRNHAADHPACYHYQHHKLQTPLHAFYLSISVF